MKALLIVKAGVILTKIFGKLNWYLQWDDDLWYDLSIGLLRLAVHFHVSFYGHHLKHLSAPAATRSHHEYLPVHALPDLLAPARLAALQMYLI